MKKGIFGLAASVLMLASVAFPALAGEGTSRRSDGTTYVELWGGRDGNLSLEGTDESCGSGGNSYDYMGAIINSGTISYKIIDWCDGGLVKVRVKNSWGTGVSTYYQN